MTRIFNVQIAKPMLWCVWVLSVLFSLQAQAQDCNPDLTSPTCQAPPDVTVSCENFDPSLLAYGSATANDNCCLDHVNVAVNYTLFDTFCLKGTITRVFQAFDCAGNSSTLGVATAIQTIVVSYTQHYFIKFPNDVVTTVQSPNGAYGAPIFYQEDCEILGVSFTDVIFPDPANSQIRIERTWAVINWCTYDPALPTILVPNPNPNPIVNHATNLPGPTVSEPGTAVPWAPTITKITPADPAPTNYSIFWDANANRYDYTQFITLLDTTLTALSGKVFQDTSNNCAYDNGEPLLGGWMVKIRGLSTGLTYETSTNASGQYGLTLLATDTLVEVSLASAVNFSPSCPNVFTVQMIQGQVVLQDIPVQLISECPILSVDLATPVLRRCFANNYYVAKGCNLSSETVENASVEVQLDNYLTYNVSSIPASPLPDNAYSFDLGDLEAGACKSFTIHVTVNCDAPLGATHCSSARIYPDTLCEWEGAYVKVEALCDGDSVRFAISNKGKGDMSQLADFVVVEDVIMRQMGQFQLDIDQTLPLTLPANGSTWRLEASQAPGFPWDGPVSATVEGCAGLNTTGLVTLFPINNSNPFESRSCQQNTGSYDPNDKSAVPQGFGADHLIEANTDLEYLIRFQNTGTDTAFTVVVLDTLSQYLEAASVRPGASSQEYEFAVLDGNVLRFIFNNILLPDSNVNEAASHGFVKFRISQKADLPDDTRIENQAAIFFDYNEAVLTNTTFHVIGDHFITVSTDDLPMDGLLRVFPNPAADAVVFELKNWTDDGHILLYDQFGREIWERNFEGKEVRFERKNLPAGMYHFQITSGSTLLSTGKVILR